MERGCIHPLSLKEASLSLFLLPLDCCSLTFSLLPALSQNPTIFLPSTSSGFFVSGWELVAFVPHQLVDSDFSGRVAVWKLRPPS